VGSEPQPQAHFCAFLARKSHLVVIFVAIFMQCFLVPADGGVRWSSSNLAEQLSRRCVAVLLYTSYHVIPEALSLRELKTKCEADELMTLSDDDDALSLHCSVTQQVSKCLVLWRKGAGLTIKRS